MSNKTQSATASSTYEAKLREAIAAAITTKVEKAKKRVAA
jgi:hypothetical protein